MIDVCHSTLLRQWLAAAAAVGLLVRGPQKSDRPTTAVVVGSPFQLLRCKSGNIFLLPAETFGSAPRKQESLQDRLARKHNHVITAPVSIMKRYKTE